MTAWTWRGEAGSLVYGKERRVMRKPVEVCSTVALGKRVEARKRRAVGVLRAASRAGEGSGL